MSEIRVTVPCSTSNLGAGFDCIGLALDRYLTATYESGDGALRVERAGTLEGLPDHDEDIVARVLRDQFPDLSGSLQLDSTIPVGKGLGSSAAATIAGLAIASAIRKQDFEYDAALHAAAQLEGHPDNAAPALLGGLVGVVTEGTRLRPLQLYLSEDIAFVFAAPRAIVSTKAARKALPDQIPHSSAARTVARTLALLEGLADADPDLLRIGFDDELHVPYRIGMIPGGVHAMDAALSAGAWAATISGSGSGLIAVCAHGDEETVLVALTNAFEAATDEAAIAFVANPDFNGTRFERMS